MPRPPRQLLRGRGKDRNTKDSKVLIDYPTRAQLGHLKPHELDGLKDAARSASANTSSDSDHLITRKRNGKGKKSPLADDDPTLVSGALAPNTNKANMAHSKSLESQATKKVRRSLALEGAKKTLRRPSDKVQETASALRDKARSTRKKGDGFGWSQEEMGVSPQSGRREQREQVDGQGGADDLAEASASGGVAKEDARRGEAAAQSRVAETARGASRPAQTRANVPATPSFLRIENFKRRPRQPSLLSQVQRAESRRNSISTAVSRDDNTGIELGDGVGDDSVLDLRDSPSPEEDELEPDYVALRTTSSKKRKRDQVEVISSQVGSSPPLGAAEARADNQALDDLDHDMTIANTQLEPDVQYESPPNNLRNSGSSAEPLPPPRQSQPEQSRSSRRSARSQPARESSPINATSPISTPPSSPAQPPPPSSTSKPVSAKRSRKMTAKSSAKAKPNKPMTTQQLAALLPKRNTRRQRPRKADEFQILSDSEHDDAQMHVSEDEDASADELAASSRARAKKAKQTKALARSAANGKSPAGKTAVNGKKKTYGRRSSAAFDAENAQEVSSGEDEEDGGVRVAGETRVKSKTAELKDAKKKFEEVDEWELSFESADIGAGGSSSPWR